MNSTLSTKINFTHRTVATILALFASLIIILTWMQDSVRAELNNTSFYFIESFIFSSFWWLFVPLCFAQYYFGGYSKNKKKVELLIVLITVPIAVHLFAFPCIVWLLSKALYYHTYAIFQTFSYALAEHFYLLLSIYSIPIVTFNFYLKKTKGEAMFSEVKEKPMEAQHTRTFLVSDGSKKQCIEVDDILYFLANPPYIDIHTAEKKYLHSETLRSVSIKLDPEVFIRIHKSTIVNITKVVSYTSRLNGDYDLSMSNTISLRLSRTYAADFKPLFNKIHHLTTN